MSKHLSRGGKRECLPCTACCKGWFSSRRIKMSPGNPCQYCTDDGCSIFEHRPQSPCREFECAWLQAGSELPAELRPDLSGVIVVTGRQFKGQDVIMATPNGWAIPERTLQWLMGWSKRKNIPLIWIENVREKGQYTHFKRSGYGPLDFLEAVRDSSEPLEIREI